VSQLFNLTNDFLRERALEAVRAAPEGDRVIILKPKRTLNQNALIHPIIRQIAVDAYRPVDEEALRRLRYLLLEAWRNETGRQPMFERSLDGMRMVNVDGGTSDLEKPDCSEFIEWMFAWHALHTNPRE
jgi:hypothetical protein